MALKIVKSEQKADKPYLNVYMESLSKVKLKELDETVWFVQKIKVSTKGYILETTEFVAFAWKNGTDGKMVKEHLDGTFDENDSTLFVVIDVSAKYGFAIGIDDEVTNLCEFDEKQATYHFRLSTSSDEHQDTHQSHQPPTTSLKPSEDKMANKLKRKAKGSTRTTGDDSDDSSSYV
jgi:hypothetical protein